eukprot:2642673-Rhodomonas_salina.4
MAPAQQMHVTCTRDIAIILVTVRLYWYLVIVLIHFLHPRPHPHHPHNPPPLPPSPPPPPHHHHHHHNPVTIVITIITRCSSSSKETNVTTIINIMIKAAEQYWALHLAGSVLRTRIPGTASHSLLAPSCPTAEPGSVQRAHKQTLGGGN